MLKLNFPISLAAELRCPSLTGCRNHSGKPEKHWETRSTNHMLRSANSMHGPIIRSASNCHLHAWTNHTLCFKLSSPCMDQSYALLQTVLFIHGPIIRSASNCHLHEWTNHTLCFKLSSPCMNQSYALLQTVLSMNEPIAFNEYCW